MKILNARDLPEERLSTTDERGGRIYIHPDEAKGKYRRRKDWLHPFLILLFLAVPWIRIRGEPLLLLDFPHRHFSLFGFSFWAHDAPLLLLFLVSFVLLIGLVTVLWGRLWCGWACPQSVFTESVFRKIEAWIEGDAVARRKLDASPWSAGKLEKKGLKWAAFLGVSALLAHSFIAYFTGAEALGHMMTRSPLEHPGTFLSMLFVTLLLAFDFGWFREQFCTIACPYGRFQSVLMDRNSLVIGYDERRGEPRRNAALPSAKEGDCVDCFRCVNVCPTGIDIRRGTQMECIACAACIDACDEVMMRLGRERGLIRYDSEAGFKGEARQGFGFPVWLYSGLLLLVLLGLGWNLSHRQEFNIAFTRAPEKPYQLVQEGAQTWIINHFKLDAGNQSKQAKNLSLALEPSLAAQGLSLVVPLQPFRLAPGEKARGDVFVKAPAAFISAGKRSLDIYLGDSQAPIGPHAQKEEVTLVGPLSAAH